MKNLTATCAVLVVLAAPALGDTAQVGARPEYLVSQMTDGPLKEKLASCLGNNFQSTPFSIAHRGAPMQFPEHTAEGYAAGTAMGAGIIECDVTFTSDGALVCRHAQNDLHTSTNILGTELAAKCTTPFTPASGETAASAECRTSDLTLAEFTSLKGKMDGANIKAATADAYMDGTAGWRTDLYAGEANTLVTLDESIALIKSLGRKFTPELKAPSVEMPYKGMSQQDYAQKMIDAFKAAGVPASDVWAQSFNLDDVLYWIENEPDFGAQAVYLTEPGDDTFDNQNPETWGHNMADLKAKGVNYIAPPLFVLLTVENGKIVPSAYATEAKDAGLKIITWSLERSGPLQTGGGWYYSSVNDVINSDGMMYEVVDVLALQVGVVGIFSDWPATVTFYANCMGLN